MTMEFLRQNPRRITHFITRFISFEKQWYNGNRTSAWCFIQRCGRRKNKRKNSLRSGNIYAVIGLPANLFYNTSIPTCIIVLKKHREGRDVLFIDASQKFEKGKKQNTMTDEHIDAVIDLYHKRETVEKEAFLASFEDIEKNDFNLNIPRYVDNF